MAEKLLHVTMNTYLNKTIPFGENNNTNGQYNIPEFWLFLHDNSGSSWSYLFSQNNPSPNSSNFVGQKPTRARVVLLFKYADYK